MGDLRTVTPFGRPRFSLGHIVATPAALEVLTSSSESPITFVHRHQRGDWGNLWAEDKNANDDAVAHEGDPERQQRVLSAYRLSDGTKIWVVTEWDRSATTLLLPEEY